MAINPNVGSAKIKATMLQLYDTFLKRTNKGQVAAIDKLTMKMASENNADTETFTIQGDIGGFRRWEDGTPRSYTDFDTFDYTVAFARYQNGIRWDRKDAEDLQVQRVEKAYKDLTVKYDLLKVDMFYQILNNAQDARLLKTVPLCPDGLPLFSSQRALFGANGNIVAGSGVSTGSKIQADLEAGILRLQGLKDIHGDPYHGDSLRQSGLMILVATGRYKAFTEGLKLKYVEGSNGGSTENFVASSYGNIEIVETPRLSGNDWYLFATGEEVHKPIMNMTRSDTGGLELRYFDESHLELAREDKREMLARVRIAMGCSYNFAGVKVSNT